MALNGCDRDRITCLHMLEILKWVFPIEMGHFGIIGLYVTKSMQKFKKGKPFRPVWNYLCNNHFGYLCVLRGSDAA